MLELNSIIVFFFNYYFFVVSVTISRAFSLIDSNSIGLDLIGFDNGKCNVCPFPADKPIGPDFLR